MDPLAETTTQPEDGAAEFPEGAQIAPGQPPSLEQLLKPGKPLHSKILQRLNSRIELSDRHMSQRRDEYARADEKRRMYVNLARPARRGNKTNDTTKFEMPVDRSIVIPVSYAAHETRKAEMASDFFFRAPFTQLDGTGIEDIKPAKITEVKLEYDYQQSDGPLAVYSMIQDADAYGVGYVYDHWDEVKGWTSVPPDPMMVQLSQMIGLPPPEPTRQYGVVKQFTRWSPVDPYMALPDPRVTRGRLQEGDFFGHDSFRSYLWLEERSSAKGGNYINCEELKKQSAGMSQSGDTRVSDRTMGPDAQAFAMKDSADEKDKGFYRISNLQVRLVPQEWGIGDGDDPEIWWFAIADKRIIVRAHKSAYEHMEFTYAAGEVGYDIHQYANPGTIEQMDGLQRTIDWLANSRIENVRKFLNDMIVFSPELIEEDDVIHPGPARWIRMTRQGTLAAMQGLNVNNMLQQLQVQDVTGPHFEIINFLMEMSNKLASANDTMQGQPLPDKRTLGEINNAVAAGSKRLKVTSRILDTQVFKPLALRAIQNAQQFTDIQQWVRVVGDYAELDQVSMGRLLVSRQDMQGNFDYQPMSALTPQDPARMLQVWSTLYDIAAQNPALSTPDPLDPTVLDLKGLFKMVGRLGGAREIDSLFKELPMMAGPGQAPPGVLPDEQIDQGVQAGNLVPMDQAPPIQ